MNDIAFVYHYWNIEDFKSYYGYKESWDKRYSPFEIFITHPTIEKNTTKQYTGSIRQKKWKQDKLDGKIYGEIIAVFTGENAGELAHEYEHQMIINHKKLYGKETLYNGNDGYAKFITNTYETIWVTDNNNNSYRINQDELEEYLNNGYKIGRNIKGKKKPKSFGEALGDRLRGVPKTAEENRKNSESHKGKIPGNKGKKTKKLNWLTPQGDVVQMDRANAHKWHSDWILIE